MSDKIKKSSLQEAKANFEEIQNFAMNEASKNLQEEVSKKVIELMNKYLNEGEVNENVTIDANGTKVEISDEGAVTVDSSEMEDTDISMDMDDMGVDMDDEELVVSDEEDEIEIDNSEIEEMEHIEETNFEEQDAMPAAAAASAEPAPEVAAEMPIEEPGAEMPIEEPAMANPFEEIGNKLDQLINIMGGQGGAGEEVEIVDDAAMAAPGMEAPAMEAPVAEEITFEVVNDMQVPEEMDVLEIVGEMENEGLEEDTMEEVKMMGHSHSVQKSTGTSAGPEVAIKNRERLALKENKDKAQYEARIAELMKENEGLKDEANKKEDELIKFSNGFVKLQENFGEMQDYNAKLVMAYKVAMSGGLTTDEKVQISEQFDNCETVDEAEKLYKSIVKEHKIKVNKNPENSIKSNSVKSVKSTKSESQPLYESKEVKRWKELAGINKK